MVAIFPKLCFWRRSLCSNLGGIDPEKLYRATLRFSRSLRASSPIWASETRSRVLARLASLAQIGELARSWLILALMKLSAVGRNTTVE